MSTYEELKVKNTDQLEIAYEKMNATIDQLRAELATRPASDSFLFSVTPPTVAEIEAKGYTVGDLAVLKVGVQKIVGF